MTLRDPPLVENRDGHVVGPRVRDQLTQEDDLEADVVGDRGELAGSSDSEMAGIGR